MAHGKSIKKTKTIIPSEKRKKKGKADSKSG